jgi:hypothetical protein
MDASSILWLLFLATYLGVPNGERKVLYCNCFEKNCITAVNNMLHRYKEIKKC